MSNKNTQGDYNEYVRSQEAILVNRFYVHGPSANPSVTLFPGNGLLAGPMHTNQLASNSVDIESYLRGTRANDLVNGPFQCLPEINHIKSLDLFEKSAPVMPQPLVVSRNNRPMIWN